ncbi:MAG: transporter [Bradymonadales bacterium]|nr:transporter [Bradymonadales bacterium]
MSNVVGGRAVLVLLAFLAGWSMLARFSLPSGAQEMGGPLPGEGRSGEDLYRAACSSCHGLDGRGIPQHIVGFDVPLPDFTDCSFATREPDEDWAAVAHEGGPTRGFSQLMPSFGGAMTDEQVDLTLGHIRTLCEDRSWPRGELNFPRAMFTEKAYPEDEAVYTIGVTTEAPVRIFNELIYEKRFGAQNQFEIVVPFMFFDQEAAADGSGPTGWTGGLGDLALGVKRALFHSFSGGSIFALTGEIILPTGNSDRGFGKGTFVFEPFLSFGQDFGPGGFLQVQAGAELPFDPDKAEMEGFWRAVYGHTFTQGRFGRAWSPMVEVLGASEFEEDAAISWDIVPQFQVTLNTRQHVMANLAVRIPLEPDNDRPVEVLAYLLWDWFDGGFFEGW